MTVHPSHRSSGRGFTLIEVVISLALLVLMSGLLMGFLWNLSRDRRAILNILKVQRTADVVFDRLAEDVAGSLATSGVGAGVRGTETSLTLVSRGVFVTAPGTTTQMGDAQTTTIEFVKDAGEITIVHNAGTSGAGTPEVVSHRVAQLRFRYHDGSSWQTSFDSQSADNLPVAVEVAIWFVTPGSDDVVPPVDPNADPAGREHPSDRSLDLRADLGGDWLDEDLADGEIEIKPEQMREPDRVRVLIVPDGPSGTWSAFGSDDFDGGSE